MGDIINSLFPKDKSKNGANFNGKQRRYILWLGALAVLGIFLMTFANSTSNKNDSIVKEAPEANNEIVLEKGNSGLAAAEASLENRLANIISQIAGAGEVAVNLTLNSSPEYQYAINSKIDKTEINEQDQSGGTRETIETREDAQVVMKSMTQGQDEPVIQKEIRPEVVGVMIVAQGANDLVIKERISEAVQTLLSIPAHRVTVLPKSR